MLQTDRLCIRRTTIEDAAFICELLNTESWLRFIGDRQVHSISDAKTYIQHKMYPQFERLGFSCNTVLTRKDSKKIGTCGVYERPGLEVPDVGFAFLPDFEGQGYGYESAITVLNDVRDNFGIKQVSAITVEDNVSSQKLLKKLGLNFSKMITMPNDDEKLMYFLS